MFHVIHWLSSAQPRRLRYQFELPQREFMLKYQQIDHTADIGIEIFGTTLEELFSNAAFALFDIITDISSVACATELKLTVTGIDREQLLVDWLSELLYLHDVKNLLFREFHVIAVSDTQITATVRGEAFAEDRHAMKTEIKAVTHHGLFIVREGNSWRARVIFDL